MYTVDCKYQNMHFQYDSLSKWHTSVVLESKTGNVYKIIRISFRTKPGKKLLSNPLLPHEFHLDFKSSLDS